MQHYPNLDAWGAPPPQGGAAYPPQQHYPGAPPAALAGPGYGPPAPSGYPAPGSYASALPYGQAQGHAPHTSAYPPQPHVLGGHQYPPSTQFGHAAPAAYSCAHHQPQQLPGGYPAQHAPQHTPQHAPQHAPAVPNPGGQVAVIDARFCFAQPLELIMREAVTFGSYGSDNFQITDTSGRVHFMLKASHFSLSDKRFLLDPSGQPVVGMAKKLLAMKPTWTMHRGGAIDGFNQVAVVKAHHSFTPSVSVYLNDGDKESDFKIRGNFRAKKFVISQKLPGGRERQIAEVRKESRFASATAFLTAAFTNADNYMLHIQPGVDAAFVVAVATLVDELFHDQEQR